MTDEERKPNRLIHEKSPYLLQHAYNPVDWYPWGEEAFEKAKRENKPVFLSIGYSTCHWCHNMARESFEDEEIASSLNEHFVPVKVDREERPDIDEVYMKVCQAVTGQGGWPLTVILTPEKVPVFAGTYFPRERRYNLPGMNDLLPALADKWNREREEMEKNGMDVLEALKAPRQKNDEKIITHETLRRAAVELKDRHDPQYGGFGSAPKFPMPHTLTYLLRWWYRDGDEGALQVVYHTLEQMQKGGIFDHVGYGFHRYSVDEKWFLPHFEKMLYDQALLAEAYLEAYQASGVQEFSDTAHKIFTYVLDDMQDPGGAFYAAENAESEGEEGRYYLWDYGELLELLGPEKGELVAAFFGATEDGNLGDGKNLLYTPLREKDFVQQHNLNLREWHFTLEESRKKLLEGRAERVRPSTDDKILTSWNGLMIGALARGAPALKSGFYLEQACRAADFILENLQAEDGRLYRRYRAGEVSIDGFLEDYAFFVSALLDLFEASQIPRYLEKAMELNGKMMELFSGDNGGGFYFSPDAGELPLNPMEAYDGAVPSANSAAALNLLRLSHFTADQNLEKRARGVIESFSRDIQRAPSAFTALLSAADFALGPVEQIILAGEPGEKESGRMFQLLHTRFLPRRIVLFNASAARERLKQNCPFLEGKTPLENRPTAYVCRGYTCRAPVQSAEDLDRLLEEGAP